MLATRLCWIESLRHVGVATAVGFALAVAAPALAQNAGSAAAASQPALVSDPHVVSARSVAGGLPELTLSKTASAASFTVGVAASYTLQLFNTGIAATTATATISDTIPAGLTLGSLPAGCTTSGQTVNCTVSAGLAAGGSTGFVIPVTPTAAAQPSVTNTAMVSGGGDPTCPAAARCSSTVGPTAVNSPELTLSKTASAASFTVGVAASYTLQLTNTGIAATTATATISDTIPVGLTLGALPAGCTTSGQTVSCTVSAGLAAGGSTSFVIPVTPTAAAQPSVTNTAMVSGGGDPTCPAAARCSSTVGPIAVDAPNVPELRLSKTASAASFTVGVAASYTLQLFNTGIASTTATTTISDTIPAGLTLGSLPAGCTASGQTVSCTVSAGLAAGGSTGFVIPVTPTAAAQPSVTNTAMVSGGGDPTCPAAARCSSTVGPTAVDAPNVPELRLSKTASAASFTVGVAASYTLQLTNTGIAATTATATISDTIPAGLTLGSLPAGCTTSGQTVSCTVLAGLAAGGSTSFVIPVTPTAAAQPSVTNTAMVSGGGDPTCPAAARCSSTAITPVVGPTVQVSKSATPVSGVRVNPGDSIGYSVQVQISGAALSAPLELTDTLDAQLMLGAISNGAFTCNAVNPLVCSLPTGTPVGSYSLTYSATVAANADGAVNNAVVISANGGDPNPTCLPCTTQNPLAQADLNVLKTVDQASPRYGATIQFTVMVHNDGPDAATGVQVVDALPSGFTLLDTTASQGSYAAPVWDIGSLEVGAAATLQMAVRVDTGGSYRNEATVVADQFDPINDNNVDEVEPVPRVLPGATVVPIDALWARLALMGLMLGISVLYLRRRG